MQRKVDLGDPESQDDLVGFRGCPHPLYGDGVCACGVDGVCLQSSVPTLGLSDASEGMA